MMVANNQDLIQQALNSCDPKIIELAYKYLKLPEIYKNDPVGYANNILDVRLWSKQIEIAEALIKYKRVLVESANGIGKSFLSAVIALWFHETHIPSITCISGPTARQVSDITFKEIRRLYKGKGLMPKQPRLHKSSDHYIYGFTATDATAFQGIHAENILIIFEECTGVASEFWEAASGILVGGESTYMLAVCNPTDTSSQAYLEKQTGRWHTISISALDHPNIKLELEGKSPLIPGAVRLSEVSSLIEQWCEPVKDEPDANDFEFNGHWWRPGPIADARLLGRYPTQGSYSIFNETDFTKSLIPINETGEIVIGCFVAGTLIDTINGKVEIQNIKIGEQVLTRDGYKEVSHSFCTGIKSTFTITCDDGTTLTGTAEHPIWVGDRWKNLAEITSNDIIYTWKELFTTELHGPEIQNQNTSGIGIISEGVFQHEEKAIHYTDISGKSLTDQSLKECVSTTKIVTHPITILIIWNASHAHNIVSNTWITCESKELIFAKSARKNIHTSQFPHDSVPTNVNVNGEELTTLMMFNGIAQNVEQFSPAVNTNKLQLVPLRVKTIKAGEQKKVYNLTVADCPEYFANGILVHNCDVARFGNDNTCIHIINGQSSIYHESYNGRDTNYTANRIKQLADKFAGDEATKIKIHVDSTGIGGGLADQKGSYNFIEINSSHRANNEEAYPNKRSELLFTVSELMKKGLLSFANLPFEQFQELKRQALGITYKLDNKGRRVAERKDDIKKRIGRSPDDLDAVALAYCGKSHLYDLGEYFDRLTTNIMTPIQYQKELKLAKNEDSMAAPSDYKQVNMIKTFGTYQARPLIRGIETALVDYQTQHEACYAVNVAHKLQGLPEPNKLNKVLDKEVCLKIEKQVKELLLKRKVKFVEDKPKVEEVKKVQLDK